MQSPFWVILGFLAWVCWLAGREKLLLALHTTFPGLPHTRTKRNNKAKKATGAVMALGVIDSSTPPNEN